MPHGQPPGGARAERAGLFEAVAPRYDLLNDLMSAGLHRRWKRRLAELAGRPRDALDLCCGTGDVARLLPGRVVGVDFSRGMLRLAAARGGGVRWLEADALALPFAQGSFDAVTVAYGLRNLADLELGLREAFRVLRPGGGLFSLDFGKPASPWLRGAWFAYLGLVPPLLGRLFGAGAGAYGYILESLRAYPGQAGVKAGMARAGFIGCGVEELCGGAMAINFGRKP